MIEVMIYDPERSRVECWRAETWMSVDEAAFTMMGAVWQWTKEYDTHCTPWPGWTDKMDTTIAFRPGMIARWKNIPTDGE